MKLMGIDYGEAKIGLAVSFGELAEPLKIIRKPNLKDQITKICEDLGIEKIIIGLSEGKMAEKTKEFASKLASVVYLPIEFQDETLTSQEAVAKMREIGKRVKDEDAISAALILQTYIDSQLVIRN
mgnify:CR=1 FL=1